MKHPLLVELLTEELPPKSLRPLSEAFAAGIVARLGELGFLDPASSHSAFATPRRMAVRITQVAKTSPDRPIEVKGPYLATGLDAKGQPTPALLGFARKRGVAVERLERARDEKGEHFVHRDLLKGAPLAGVLGAEVAEVVKKLPVPKLMRWGAGEAEFVRPVHGLVMLHGHEVVPGEVLGLQSGSATRGHRFMGEEGRLTLSHPDQYEELLEAKGAVIPGFEKRREAIRRALEEAAGGARLADPEPLLEEVTALVEFPVVYEGTFSAAFLEVPQECLILSMKQHQKYFPLLDAKSGRLLPRFLIVANLKAAAKAIVQGNERVLRARLADARFFFEHDRATRLEARVPRLAQVVYHNRLGSQLDRVGRIRKLAGAIAHRLGADAAAAERAALLCKADLLTDMVGEFPELQGVMGTYYARHDGEPEAVARAIEAHYRPRFAGDTLPQDNLGAAVALADKLDTLTGIYGVGGAPTGDKDPFALRRQALGVLRILAEQALPLDLPALLQLARSHFPRETVAESVALDLHQFMLERLRGYLRERGFQADEIEAVVAQRPARIDQVLPRLAAVRAFRKLPEAEALASANKRIQNILRKAEVPDAAPDVSLLQEPAERALAAATAELAPEVASLLENGDYTQALCALARARQAVDTFFDEVMVMTDEPLLRANRLALLRQLGGLMNQVADIAKLAASP